ncbi:MAG: glycogen/starch synthase [Bacteroidaceae bacterium]|nr:glycogen/starch synthase [Bacteroidaceae bacterium]
MDSERIIPTFVFESSWEVCNKVGGIYTVLSTRAKTLQETLGDHLVFIGPDFWKGRENPLFEEDKTMWAKWVKKAEREGISVRTGRWNIPGKPCVVLVDFTPYFVAKDQIYGQAWADFGVESLHGYGDYDEASMFSFAAGRVVESYYNYFLSKGKERVVYQAHEWMTGLGALYVRKHVPAVATVFTTHATSIGRSIAGNEKPLYDYLYAYNGIQMAQELNMEAKHSIERQTAHNVDCFTTVSDVTDRECEELLDKRCDAVLMNGFESDFVPTGTKFATSRKKARQALLRVANALTGTTFGDDTLIVATSGRYEFKNKGIDVFLEAMHRLDWQEELHRPIVAFVEVPGWVAGPRHDLQERLAKEENYDTPLSMPMITHQINEEQNDKVLNTLRWFNKSNRQEEKVKVIFVPCYLDGNDGIFNMSYYDLLIGNDLSIYPSYYEPWGYTPLESIAFHVPCITTSLSGFGMWANKIKSGAAKSENGEMYSTLKDGAKVIHRTDYNYSEVADNIVRAVLEYALWDKKTVDAARKNAAALAEKALWKHFIQYYFEAYDIALRKAELRKERLF